MTKSIEIGIIINMNYILSLTLTLGLENIPNFLCCGKSFVLILFFIFFKEDFWVSHVPPVVTRTQDLIAYFLSYRAFYHLRYPISSIYMYNLTYYFFFFANMDVSTSSSEFTLLNRSSDTSHLHKLESLCHELKTP